VYIKELSCSQAKMIIETRDFPFLQGYLAFFNDQDSNDRFFALTVDNEVVSIVNVSIYKQDKEFMIQLLETSPSHANKGYGTTLVREIITQYNTYNAPIFIEIQSIGTYYIVKRLKNELSQYTWDIHNECDMLIL